MSSKAVIKVPKGRTQMFEIKLTLTAGELMSLRNGMKAYGEAGSNVGADVGGYVQNAIDACPEAKNFIG